MEINKDLRQRHIDAYFPLLRGIPVEEYSAPERAAMIVRAGVQAGIVIGVTVEGIDDEKPGLVIKMLGELNKAVAEALTVPPD